ncbi:MAG TPA: hypothetical protein VF972_11825 [Actinomycetota bacterium]
MDKSRNGKKDGDAGALGLLPRVGKPVSVVIGIRQPGLRQEVLDFLGRDPRLDIAGSALPGGPAGPLPLTDVQVLCPSAAAAFAPPQPGQPAPTTLIVTQEVSVATLRTAIRVGAKAVFQWPEERDDLAHAAAGARSWTADRGPARGQVVAVAGARGGSGATFLATHLAAAFATGANRTVLVDADPIHSDVTAALGILPGDQVRTIADLLPVLPELSPDHLTDVLFQHPGGFSILLGPGEPDESVRPGVYRAAIALLALEYDPVIVHLARPGDPSARAIASMADVLLLVTALDLLSLFGARRVMAALGVDHGADRWIPVVNRAGRSPLGRADVERILGIRPRLSIRADSRVPRAQGRGALVPAGSRGAARDVRRVADALVEAGEGTGRSLRTKA